VVIHKIFYASDRSEPVIDVAEPVIDVALQLGRYAESLQLTMVRAKHFYMLVPRFSADPPTHSATIR